MTEKDNNPIKVNNPIKADRLPMIASIQRVLENKDKDFGFSRMINDLRENSTLYTSEQLQDLINLLSSPENYEKCHKDRNSFDYHDWWTLSNMLYIVINDRKSRDQ